MIRISAISILTLFLFALTLEAQTSTDLLRLAKYPTRLTTTLETVSKGYLYSAGDTAVQILKFLQVDGKTGVKDIETVPIPLLNSLEFKVGKSRKKGARIGAAIGAGVGLVLALVFVNCNNCDLSSRDRFLIKGLVFLTPTVLGAGIGYWEGAPHFGVRFDIGGKQSEYERQKADIQKYSMMR